LIEIITGICGQLAMRYGAFVVDDISWFLFDLLVIQQSTKD
jgi:hypothetical protein